MNLSERESHRPAVKFRKLDTVTLCAVKALDEGLNGGSDSDSDSESDDDNSDSGPLFEDRHFRFQVDDAIELKSMALGDLLAPDSERSDDPPEVLSASTADAPPREMSVGDIDWISIRGQ
jgi:hypothetical protein